MRNQSLSPIPYRDFVISFVFCLLACASVLLQAEDQKPLRAGATKVNITPSNLANLNSFGGGFSSVHDPFFARALVLDNSVNIVAMVARPD